VGEYRYHRALPAYSNLRANAQLALDGALGHVTEVLSGDYYQPLSTSSPHQIWSAAMVVSPILQGLLGLRRDALNRQIAFAPHVPADWTSFAVRNVHVGAASVEFQYRKSADGIALDVTRTGTGDCWVEFSPAVSLRAQIASVEMNHKPLPFDVQRHDEDQHVSMRFSVADGPISIVIRTKNDFGIALANELPPLGSTSRGLRVISEQWNSARNVWTVEVSGLPGRTYELKVWNQAQIRSVENGDLTKQGTIRIEMPNAPGEDYVHHVLRIRFGTS
jgi:hypothetical protein